jgi:large subunit ribosomal protein L20
MARVKRAVHSAKKRRNYFKAAKGFSGGRRRLWQYAYRDRKVRKRDFRRLWIVRLNAAVREHGISYSQFMHGAKAAGIELDRKALSNLAIEEPEVFGKICDTVKAKLAA